MFCDQCGAALSAGAAACGRCGATVEQSPIPSPRRPAAAELLPPPTTPVARVDVDQVGDRPRGPGWATWARSTLGRNLTGTGAGLIAAWFNVPFVVLLAAIGAVFGGLAGVVSGTIAGQGVLSRLDALLTWVFPLPIKAEQLLPTAAAQVGGIVGGILGAVHGAGRLAWMAAVWPWEALAEGDPTWPWAVALGQVVTALVVGALYLVWTVTTESTRLRIAGARRLSRREAAWLGPIVADVAARLGLRAVPRLLVDDRREPNASAYVRHVVINYGLLEQLDYDRDQVAGVLAHELAHWRAGDPVAMAWARGVALPLYLLYELADRLLRGSSRPLHFAVRVLLWPVLVTVRYLVVPVQARLWRQAEYRADAVAAAAGYGAGLRAALGYLRHSFDGDRSGWDRAVLATHPPNELRLERLERGEQPAPLREDHPLVRALPGWSDRSTVRKGW
ncbi:M48 family metalloprotease [Micromonospora aurantiaca (nom. illeg.)]|uniref:M48 family metalloprotease n=1 Tax=Micromonospora aurantiaca (nom. illeg.) TaxID=47850 RepID=UPI000828BF21|nr:M48 family metalloprotease [Micromonospora aurantiaca]SCL21203.1 Zn-dependent protease with chaperone function [Micromonospora aurantiaca]